MLAHVPSSGRNPRGSPDFLAYPVPKACMHALGTRVPRCLGVARSASSLKAALALGCSLTPGLRISFGRVTCMARAASVPGLWALGFLLLACVGGWVRVAVGRGFCFHLPVVAGVLGGCFWARFVVLSLFCRLFVVFVVGLWCRPAFGTCVVSCAFPLPPVVSGSGVRCGRACWARVSAVPRPSWLGCRGVFFALFFFRFLGVPVPGLVVSHRLLSFRLGCWFFFFFVGVCFFRCPFSRWAAVPGLVLPVFAGWSACACLGVLSSVPSGWGVWPPSVFLAGGLVAVCGWCVGGVPRHSWRRFLCATPRHSWLGFAAGGGGRSPPLLAGVRWRWWCVVCGVWRWCVGGVVASAWCGWSLATPGGGSCVLPPATPGWVSLPLVAGGPRHSWLGSVGGVAVWCVAVVCWWGCGWCVVWLVPRHSWRRFLCATPRHSWLGFAAGGGGRSPPLLAGVRWRWCCVVCGVWRWCAGGVVAGAWCGWSLATPGGGPCVLLPASPGWVSLLLVVGGPRHSWLGSVGGVAVWCVVCGGGVLVGLWLVCGVVGPSPLLAEVPVCYSPPVLAGFRCRWWWAVPATPGWGPLAAVVCGVWCVVCGGGVLVGLWLVCGVVGPSPLLAVVPLCFSPPLLAGFPCRWWWAVPATPGWGPLAAVVCGVWCVVCGGGVLLGLWLVCGVWRWCVVGVVVGVRCGWSLATPGCGPCVLLPATPGRVSLPVVVGGPRHSWLGSVGGGGVWCVVCGVWCVGGVPRHSWRWFLCATPRHSWLGFAGGGGVWCVAVVCCWGCGWCVVWLVPRHSW